MLEGEPRRTSARFPREVTDDAGLECTQVIALSGGIMSTEELLPSLERRGQLARQIHEQLGKVVFRLNRELALELPEDGF